MQLDQLLSKSDFPTALLGPGGRIGSVSSASTLCDQRDGWNEPVVRLSDAKVLTWLRQKVERMRHALKKVPSLQHHYSKAEREESPEQEQARLAQQANERAEAESKAKAEADATEEKTTGDSTAVDAVASPSPSTPAAGVSRSPSGVASSALKMSLQFLSAYLTPATFLTLLASYDLALDDVFERKRPAARNWEGGASGGGKITGDVEIARGSATNSSAADDKKRKPEKVSQAAKKLATAAKGTKSLASFFGAPVKKPTPAAATTPPKA